MSCKFPCAFNLKCFITNLADGNQCLGAVFKFDHCFREKKLILQIRSVCFISLAIYCLIMIGLFLIRLDFFNQIVFTEIGDGCCVKVSKRFDSESLMIETECRRKLLSICFAKASVEHDGIRNVRIRKLAVYYPIIQYS